MGELAEETSRKIIVAHDGRMELHHDAAHKIRVNQSGFVPRKVIQRDG